MLVKVARFTGTVLTEVTAPTAEVAGASVFPQAVVKTIVVKHKARTTFPVCK
ncbi:hypothetical protein HM1_1539 [Heliomicrobium modesticaldum Ice1]|uniref:Uncharacterized protein n=1 Tax=Heliobacterium modesticaldum (strain ATCC 51547 / Ice1) TaxID=498761 RepID=B0TD70_HELMI|nr:hypothetical protein HM1_1539 [Heliomicrobium modesticaldum Ice1]